MYVCVDMYVGVCVYILWGHALEEACVKVCRHTLDCSS